MATHAHPIRALPEGVRHYLVRGNPQGNSVMVPLVPVDQLPFQLQGIPRQLTHRQISDEGWKFLSETNETPFNIAVQAPTTSFSSPSNSTTQPRYLAPDHYVRREPQVPSSDHHARQEPQSLQENSRLGRSINGSTIVQSTPEPPRSMPTGASPSLTETFAAILTKDAARLGYRTPYPSGIEPDHAKKEWCTYWIMTGECAFTAIGCKYKHEMPSEEKLRDLGITRVPKWWKEKSTIIPRTSTWMQRKIAGNEDGERAAAKMRAPRAYPDPSTFRSWRKEGRDRIDDDVQHPQGILKREMGSSAQSAVLRPKAPPAAPVQAPVRRESQMSSLLIDFEETPAPPPPSPRLSHSSATSVVSSDTATPSSRSSVSPAPSPRANNRPTPVVVDRKVASRAAPEKPAAEKEASIRRHSQIIWDSNSEEETNTEPPTKPTHQLSKRSPRHAGPRRTTTAPAKQQQRGGLASSKYASHPTTHKVTTAPKPTEHRNKNVESHTRNANRRMKANEVGAPARIEHVRRDAQQKDKANKSQGRAAVVVLPPAKHTAT